MHTNIKSSDLNGKRITLYWLVWIAALSIAFGCSAHLYFRNPNTTDFFLPIIFLYFAAVIGSGVVHFTEGHKLSSYVREHYGRKISLLSNVSVLGFVYSNELSEDPQVRLLKRNYKSCVMLFSTVLITFLVFAGLLFVV